MGAGFWWCNVAGNLTYVLIMLIKKFSYLIGSWCTTVRHTMQFCYFFLSLLRLLIEIQCEIFKLGVWTYTDLTVRLDYDYVIDSVQFDHGELTMHCILNFTSHVNNFVNKYKQSDIWTEPLILPAQRKHASWMYQISNKTKSGHRRQQEHLEQIHKCKYLV